MGDNGGYGFVVSIKGLDNEDDDDDCLVGVFGK